MINYCEALKQQRETANYTQRQLANATGISQGNISRWEKGEVVPNIEFCIRLADFYGISLDELVGRDIIK
ncbi:MAG: helix-turn-helix transcriptional regulator [Clostridia bacterium]|nr:helix-turn-helix transcriptional regulator [Clostridia bacterium]